MFGIIFSSYSYSFGFSLFLGDSIGGLLLWFVERSLGFLGVGKDLIGMIKLHLQLLGLPLLLDGLGFWLLVWGGNVGLLHSIGLISLLESEFTNGLFLSGTNSFFSFLFSINWFIVDSNGVGGGDSEEGDLEEFHDFI